MQSNVKSILGIFSTRGIIINKLSLKLKLYYMQYNHFACNLSDFNNISRHTLYLKLYHFVHIKINEYCVELLYN